MMEDKIASLLGERVRDRDTESCVNSRSWKWAAEAHKHTERGDFESGLYYINLCLQSVEEQDGNHHHRHSVNGGDFSTTATMLPSEEEGQQHQQTQQLPTSEILSLIEKRCLVYMKMRHYEKAISDAQSLIQQQCNHTLAYKCLLGALCKLNQLSKVADILRIWRLASPNNLEMIECRTKVEGLMEAVARGIDARQAFSNVEELLGLNYDWLLKSKNDSRWKHRPLPPGKNTFVLCLQYRFGHCSLGQKCPDAHGGDELEEWKERATMENELVTEEPEIIRKSAVIQRLLERIDEVGNDSLVLTEENFPSGLKIKCLEPLKITVSSHKVKTYKWTFAVESKVPLLSVCLLNEIHRQYFKITSAFFHESGTRVNLIPMNVDQNSVQEVEVNLDEDYISSGSKSHGYTYSVTVKFTPELLGKFRQSVVFDFGYEPKPVRNIGAEVYPPADDEEIAGGGDTADGTEITPPGGGEEEGTVTKGPKGTWNFGNAEIVNGGTGERVPSQCLGFALINGVMKHSVVSETKEVLTRENYKEKMRFFLTEEERARQEIISKYNVSALLKISNNYAMTSGYFEGEVKYAVDGNLYGRMTLFRDISEDTAVGRLILRSCRTVLLTKTETAQQSVGKPRVYWCEITDKTKNAIYIHLGAFCVRDLNLKADDALLFDIQFQLDRTAFMEQKDVIDRLNDSHLQMLFPDFSDPLNIPWSPMMQWDGSEKLSHRKLNPKQKEALIAVTAEGEGLPPILLIGPFGTGKTYTLAQCIRKILTQPSSRVMICTQSNSAADLYIKEYLDKWCEEGFEASRPLRIYYALRSFKTVHPNVLKYCVIDRNAGRFRNPTREEILSRRVVVVTLGSSYQLMDLDLPSDTFSHIFLDEAAQAMETEAVTPLLSAGSTTKLVLAGDHMQLSPELFSDHAKNFHSSLLERLHYMYPEDHPCKLMLCENYRSHAAIIQFASESFYNKKLECGMSQPIHEKIYPLSFFAARGEDVQEADSTSYFNMAEVFEVTEKVSEIISSWPANWGSCRDESAIGVLTPYADQVSKIRARLRKKGLTHVSVERVLNVQGKQFRVVLLSTVRTHKPWVRILPEAVGKEIDFGFFSNPKLLNTALTRAQSLVAVVGDPVSLCSVGKCRVLWEDFIRVCHENKSLHGISYMQLKQNILGVEMRLTWGLNPLANEFKPKNGSNVLPSSAHSSQHLPTASSYEPATTAVLAAVPESQSPYYSQSKVSDVTGVPAPQASIPYPPTNGADRYVNIVPPAANGIIPAGVTPNHPPVHPSQVGFRPVMFPPQQQQIMRPFANSQPPYGGMNSGVPGLQQQFARFVVQPGGVAPYVAQPIPVPPGPVRAFGPGVYNPCIIGPPTHGPSIGPGPAPPFYPVPPEVHPYNMRKEHLHYSPVPPPPPPPPPPSNYQQAPYAPEMSRTSMNMHPAAGAPLYRRQAETVINPKTSPYLHQQQHAVDQASQSVSKMSSSPYQDGLSQEDLLVLKDALERYSHVGDTVTEQEQLRILRSKLGLSVSEPYRYSPGGISQGSGGGVSNLAAADYPRLKSQDSNALSAAACIVSNQQVSSNGLTNPKVHSDHSLYGFQKPNPWQADSSSGGSSYNYSSLDSRYNYNSNPSVSLPNQNYASDPQNSFRPITNKPWNEPAPSNYSQLNNSHSSIESSGSSSAIGGRSYANVVKQATAGGIPGQQQMLNNNGPSQEADPFLKYKLQAQQQCIPSSRSQLQQPPPSLQDLSLFNAYRSPQR